MVYWIRFLRKVNTELEQNFIRNLVVILGLVEKSPTVKVMDRN